MKVSTPNTDRGAKNRMSAVEPTKIPMSRIPLEGSCSYENFRIRR